MYPTQFKEMPKHASIREEGASIKEHHSSHRGNRSLTSRSLTHQDGASWDEPAWEDYDEDYASFGEDYFQSAAEDFLLSLGPVSTLTYAIGYCFGACHLLWLAETLAFQQVLSLLRLTRGGFWSRGLMAILIVQAIACLYLRARSKKTHDIVDGAFDGALAIGTACVPAAMRMSPIVPMSITALAVLAVRETVPRIWSEQERPWPEPWLPIACAACTLLKRASAISLLTGAAYAIGIL